MNYRVDNVDVKMDVFSDFDRRTISFTFVPKGIDDPLLLMLMQRHEEYLNNLPPDDGIQMLLF